MAEDQVGEQIQRCVQSLDNAFNRGDVDAVLSHYAPDALMVVRPGRTVRGHRQMRPIFEDLVRRAGGVVVLHGVVLHAADVALFIGRWQFRRGSPADREILLGQRPSFAVATSVWTRHNGDRWWLSIDNAWGTSVLGWH